MSRRLWDAMDDVVLRILHANGLSHVWTDHDDWRAIRELDHA